MRAVAPLARGEDQHPIELPTDEFWNGVENHSGEAFSAELRGAACVLCLCYRL